MSAIPKNYGFPNKYGEPVLSFCPVQSGLEDKASPMRHLLPVPLAPSIWVTKVCSAAALRSLHLLSVSFCM